MWRNVTEMSSPELTAIQSAIGTIEERCPAEGSALRALGTRIALWDTRVLRFGTPLIGRFDDRTRTLLIWSQQGAQPGDGAEYPGGVRPSWTWVIAHEITRDMYPSWTDSQRDARADYCSG